MTEARATAMDRERRAFEIWARSKGINLSISHDGTYLYRPAYYSWLGWRSRSSFGKSRS